MTIKEIIKTILVSKGILQRDVAGRLNMKQATLSERLRRNNLSTDVLGEILNAVDYKLIAVPRGKRLTDDEFLIDHTSNLEEPVVPEKSEKEQKEDASYDLWLRKAEFSVEQYTAELEKIWGDDKKRISSDFEKYMKWYMEEKLK